MDWNQIGWKCKRQKKFIDFFILTSLALVILIIILTNRLGKIEYIATADMAAEAAVPAHWVDVYRSSLRSLNQQISSLEETCAELETQLEALQP